jgi:F-type H+-transporting ATPase subunit gamma
MSDTLDDLRRKIDGAKELASVVRTMKAVSASSIGQYESAVSALTDYYRTVELALSVSFRSADSTVSQSQVVDTVGAIAFGSDQGLVGQFNDVLADFVSVTLGKIGGKKRLWAVGERIRSSLVDLSVTWDSSLALPTSVAAITPLVGQIVTVIDDRLAKREIGELYLFHNRPKQGSVYEPVSQRLLPLDAAWQINVKDVAWPTAQMPELIGYIQPSLIREYLFISIFRACAESLASENASRLAAMQRAEKNITDLLEDLNQSFHRQRQSSIDDELFDVVSGFEALT